MSWFHRHKWEAVGVDHYSRSSWNHLADEWAPQPWITKVLRKCLCGKTSTQSLTGRWELEQLRGKS